MRSSKKPDGLPPCVYLKHGAYWLVKRGKWTRLGNERDAALAAYARLAAQNADGMPALIDAAMPGILKGKAEQTVAQYQVAARRLKEIFAEFAPEDVAPRHVAKMIEAFEESPAVANRTTTVLKRVFAYALKQQIVDVNPCVGIERLSLASRKRRITRQEYSAIRAHAKPRLRVVMDLCYLTGQRIGDVLSIRRSDLLDDGIYIEQQKTRKRLLVAWTPELKATVEAAKALHGPVAGLWLLKGRQGMPMTYTVAWKDWRAACKAAGVKDANLHDLRAMSGTEAKSQGHDPQALLGHTDARTTRIYLRDHELPVVQGPAFRVSKKRGRVQ